MKNRLIKTTIVLLLTTFAALAAPAPKVWEPKVPSDTTSAPENVRIVKFGMDHRRIMDGNAQGIGSYNRYRIDRTSSSNLWKVRAAGKDIQQFNDFDVDGDGQTADDRVGCHPFSLDADNPISPVAPWYDTSVGCQKMYGGAVLFQADAKKDYSIFSEDGINEGEEGPAYQPRSNWTFFHETYEIFSPFRMYFIGFWQKQDFENGGAQYRVSFDENSELRHLVMRYYMGMEGFRWVVRNGDQFYISEEVYKYADEDPTRSGGKIHTVKPAAIRWAKYNPQAPYHVDFDAKIAVFEKQNFDNVTAVGHLMFKDSLVSGYVGYKWYAFEADAVVNRPKQPSQNIAMTEIKATALPSFYISTCEVPYELWRKVHRLGRSNTFAGPRGCNFDNYGDMGSMHFPGSDGKYLSHDQNEPVTGIPLYDMLAWCNALSVQESKTPCYYTDPEFKEPFREVLKSPLYPEAVRNAKPTIYVKWDASGYRLPTTAEWAAANQGSEVKGQRSDKTLAVGSGSPNKQGVYDLIGNVWEPVWTFGDSLAPEAFDSFTALGGDFRGLENPEANSASAYGDHPFNGHFAIGLRLVRREAGIGKPAQSAPLTAPEWVVKKDTLTAPDATHQLAAPLKEPWLRTVDIPGKPYAFGKFEVSFEQWVPVYDWAVANGYVFDNGGDMGSMAYWGFGKGWTPGSHSLDEPVAGITLHDAIVWLNALSELEGRTPVYCTEEAPDQPVKTAFIYRPLQLLLGVGNRMSIKGELLDYVKSVGAHYKVRANADGYRLPEKDEFEQAQMAGSSPFPWGSDLATGRNFAWTADNSDFSTHPVGTRQPNALGLYDMIGNVAELSLHPLEKHRRTGYAIRMGGSFMDVLDGFFTSGGGEGRMHSGGIPYPDIGFRVLLQKPAPKQQAQIDPSGTQTFLKIGKNKFSWECLADLVCPSACAEEAPGGFDPLQEQVHRGNLYRTGVHRTSGLPSLKGIKWEFKTGGPVRSSPIEVNGIIYVGSYDGNVYAIDADSGAEKWKVSTSGKVSGSAAVADGTVYIASEAGVLFALDATTGAEKWKASGLDACAGSPAVAYGKVFIGGGNKGGSDILIMSAKPMLAFDAKTGAKIWQGSSGPQGYAAIATDGKYLYAGQGGSEYTAFDMKDGKAGKFWTGGHQARQFMSSTVDDDKVYNPATMRGSVLCSTTQGKTIWHTATLDDNLKFEVNGGGTFGYEIFTDLAVTADKVFAGCNDGKLYSFDKATGKKGWNFQTGAAVQSSPSVAGSAVYFGSWDGNLYAVETATGELLWKQPLGGRIISSPWPGGGVVYVGCDNGSVYALR